MNTRIVPLLFAIACSLFNAAPVHAVLDKALKSGTKTKTENDAKGAKLPEYKGVKHSLGVTDFTNEASYRSRWQIGDNLRAMLESSLFESGRFIIVERGDLGAIAAEQDLQKSGRAAQSSRVAETGKLRSARYIATGNITEVSEDTSGEGGGIRIKGFKIGGSSAKAAVVLVVKLVDTTTGEVVASKRVRGEAGKSALRLSGYTSGLGGDFGAFAKTPLGEAAQDCIDAATVFIAESMEDFAVEGVVVAISGDQVIINLGTERGVSEGLSFFVWKDGEVLMDPDTGAVLDRLEGEVTAKIEITRVREKVSYCKVVDGQMPERGDRVVSR